MRSDHIANETSNAFSGTKAPEGLQRSTAYNDSLTSDSACQFQSVLYVWMLFLFW